MVNRTYRMRAKQLLVGLQKLRDQQYRASQRAALFRRESNESRRQLRDEKIKRRRALKGVSDDV